MRIWLCRLKFPLLPDARPIPPTAKKTLKKKFPRPTGTCVRVPRTRSLCTPGYTGDMEGVIKIFVAEIYRGVTFGTPMSIECAVQASPKFMTTNYGLYAWDSPSVSVKNLIAPLSQYQHEDEPEPKILLEIFRARPSLN